MRKTAAKQAER